MREDLEEDPEVAEKITLPIGDLELIRDDKVGGYYINNTGEWIGEQMSVGEKAQPFIAFGIARVYDEDVGKDVNTFIGTRAFRSTNGDFYFMNFQYEYDFINYFPKGAQKESESIAVTNNYRKAILDNLSDGGERMSLRAYYSMSLSESTNVGVLFFQHLYSTDSLNTQYGFDTKTILDRLINKHGLAKAEADLSRMIFASNFQAGQWR